MPQAHGTEHGHNDKRQSGGFEKSSSYPPYSAVDDPWHKVISLFTNSSSANELTGLRSGGLLTPFEAIFSGTLKLLNACHEFLNGLAAPDYRPDAIAAATP
ncbi:MAG: hypothetical protein ABLT11_09940 [Candidatus Acidiferrum sp.]